MEDFDQKRWLIDPFGPDPPAALAGAGNIPELPGCISTSTATLAREYKR